MKPEPTPPAVSREPAGRKLFSFVVIADTHVNEHEAKSASPFETNARANARARYAFGEIAALDPAPEFVVHLGDIVNPMPGLPVYADAAARFKDIVAPLRVPLHLVPGNHDVGDKAVDWMPADIVSSAYVDLYRKTFGADYHAFDSGPLRCIVIDAQLLNSDLPEEAQQRAWLEAELAASAGRRVFVFTHYPPYVLSAEERSTYDNIDQPGRAWLLELLRRHRVEALFAGHVHNFWYDVYGQDASGGGTEMYLLPATSFLRHDYSEFYRVAPGNEFGRGDLGKFGYCVVDVHEKGHVMRLVRTDGRSLGPQEAYAGRRTPPPASVKTAPHTGVGVEMRHPWAEIAEIPSTGGVQEFGRKPARNDYPVMALWEMGARLLKLPDHDLTHTVVGERMKLMHAAGHRFIATAFGVPREPFSAALQAAPGLVEAVEVNLSTAALGRQAERLRAFRERHPGTDLYWAKLRMHEDAAYDGGHFSHFIKTGTLPAELDAALSGLEGAGLRTLLDGLVVRLERDGDLLAQAPQLAAFAERSGLALLGAIKLTDSSIARTRDDDLDTARLAAEALLAARLSPRVRYVFDTLMDIDRGYYPRNGFIDRMFNPRPALRAYAVMAHLLSGAGALSIGAGSREGGVHLRHFTLDGRPHLLACGIDAAGALAQAGGTARELWDLARGEALAPAAARAVQGSGLWVVAG
jgi:hypothetical protein